MTVAAPPTMQMPTVAAVSPVVNFNAFTTTSLLHYFTLHDHTIAVLVYA